MLTKRIIPCLDVKGGRVVKGIKFLGLKDAGDPVEIAKIYDKEEADELVFLDIAASFENRPILIDVVKKTAEQVFMPLTVGGGIRNLDDIRDLLNAGADKISLNTAAVKQPDIIKESSDRYGSQCIVVAIDAKRRQAPGARRHALKRNKPEARSPKPAASQWEVYINGGRTPTGIDAVSWAGEVASLGAGEILLTSMDFDGTKDGFDLKLTKAVTKAVNIPVIASGGAGSLEHFYDILSKGRADAALAASVFHYGEFSIKQVKEYLKNKGIEVRL